MLIVGLDDARGLPHELLGRKGHGLATLRAIGLPVPPGFILTTDTFRRWRDNGHALDDSLRAAVGERLDLLRLNVERSDSVAQPFLVSVRSSPTVSMPGLLSSILNVGVSPNWVIDQLQSDGSRQFGWEIARGFLTTYLGAAGGDAMLAENLRQADEESRSSSPHFRATIGELLRNSLAAKSMLDQVASCIGMVFRSQFKESAADALAQRAIDDGAPMALVVQTMVFGNRSETSASGVLWTRDLQSGQRSLTGTYLPAVQGPQVVGSTSAQAPLALAQMNAQWPAVFEELSRIADALDQAFPHVQEVEFTVEDERVWLLQARDAALSPLASIRYACNRVESGDWSAADAVLNTRPDALPRLVEAATSERLLPTTTVVASGLPASGGIATGPLTLRTTSGVQSDARQNSSSLPENAIVIADSLTPHDDFDLIRRCGGFVTVRGGPGTHTASLLRKLGKPYIVNLDCEVVISQDAEFVEFGGARLTKDDVVTLLGDRGHLCRGELQKSRDPAVSEQVKRFADWTASYSSRSSWRVFNYDSPMTRDIRNAVVTVLRQQPWKSEKAVITELLSLIPVAWRIEQRVFAADDRDAIRVAMVAGLEAGFWMGSKVCRSTDPRLGSGPWQTGIRTTDEVDAFLADPAYEGVSGRGGYLEWTSDPATSELVLVFDPPEKGEREAEAEHFVCTLSCSATPPQLQITLMLGTSKLRSLESASPSQLIVVTMEPDYQHDQYLGFIRPIVGRDYWSTSDRDGRAGRAIQHGEWSFRRLGGFVDARSLAVATAVTKLVLHNLWQPPLNLPHYMIAVDDEFGLETLEFQGRADHSGRIVFFKLFDAKGHEEQLFANSVGGADD